MARSSRDRGRRDHIGFGTHVEAAAPSAERGRPSEHPTIDLPVPTILSLGLAETAVTSLVDPGLTIAATYALFVIVLLIRPQGIFGRRPS